MTEREYKDIDEGLDKAVDSVVPFPVADDEMSVIGDANRTELNKHDFKITFKIPGENGYEKHVKEYNGVYITPRQQVRINRAIVALMPYFRKPDKGDVTTYTTEEKAEILEQFGDEIVDVMYELVAAVLKIDPVLTDYMTVESVMNAAANIIRMYPEMVNEGDTFFG